MKLCFFVALIAATLALTGSHPYHYRHDGPALLPDVSVTGAANPAVTQANIRSTICVSGWTKTVRPPARVTDKIKLQMLSEYGDTAKQPPLPKKGKSWDVSKCVPNSADPRCYELDHFWSLELGGAPLDKKNLWPENYFPRPGARQKDVVERYLHREVCSGRMTLARAQREISSGWYKIYLSIHK